MTSPIPMRLCCEGCGKLHIDEGAFATKPHHTHSCQHCGLTWRPAVVCTVGVQFLPGFKNDSLMEAFAEGVKMMTGSIDPIEPGQTWQHITSLALLRVKGIGQYVTGGSRIDFTDGHSMKEQALRTHYRRYLTATYKLLREQAEPDDIVIHCVFDGDPCAVTIDPREPLSAVCRRLCERTNRVGRPASDWEIRSYLGKLLAPDIKIQDEPSVWHHDRYELHLYLPVGSGG